MEEVGHGLRNRTSKGLQEGTTRLECSATQSSQEVVVREDRMRLHRGPHRGRSRLNLRTKDLVDIIRGRRGPRFPCSDVRRTEVVRCKGFPRVSPEPAHHLGEVPGSTMDVALWIE